MTIQAMLQSGTARLSGPWLRAPFRQQRAIAHASRPRRGGSRWALIVLLLIVADIVLAGAVWSIVQHVAF